MGSKSKSKSRSTQESYGSELSAIQSPFLQNMWNQGQGITNNGSNVLSGMQGYSQGMNQLGAAGFQNQMGMGELWNAGTANQQMMNQASSPYMQGAQNTFQRLQNPGVDPMMGVYAKQLGQNFNEQIMPGLQSEAMVGGNRGGSRSGIAQGLAGARMGQQLQDFGAQLYGQNQDRALQAAQGGGNLQNTIAQIYGQGATNAGNIAQGYQQGGQLSGQIGEGYQNLGQFGMSLPWYNLQQQRGLLGNNVVTDLGSRSTSKGGSSGWSIR
jgi:hypothetical protein